MKGLIRNAAAAAIATIAISTVNAQVNVGGTVNAATKASTNTTKVTNAATSATKAATGAAQATTKVAAGAVKATTNASTKAAGAASTKAGAAAGNASVKTATEANVKAGTSVKTNNNGKAAEVKEVVVTEAQGIKDEAKEVRRDIKPGLNISNKTEAGQSTEAGATVSGGEVKVEGAQQTTTSTSVDADGKKVKEKAVEVKDKAKEKAKEVKEKAKEVKAPEAKVKAEADVKAKAAAGKQ